MDKRRFEELFPEPEKKEKGAARDSDPAFFIHMKQTMRPAAPWQFPKSDSAIPHHNPIWKRRFVFSSTAAACLIVALMFPHISGFLQMSEDTDRVDVTIDTDKDKTDDIKIQAAADDYGNREETPDDDSIDQTIQSASAEEGKETGDTKTDSAQREPIGNPDRIKKGIEKPNIKQPDTEKEKLNRNQLDTEKEKPNRNQLDTEKEKPNRNQLGTEKQKPNRKQPDKEKLDIKQSDIKKPDESISNTLTGVSDKNEEPSDNSEAAEDTAVSDHDNSAQEESDQAVSTENNQPDNLPFDTDDMAVDDASSPDDSVIVDVSADDEVDDDVAEDIFLPYRYLYLPNMGYWYVCCGGSDDKESALDPYDLGNVIVSNERDFANTVRMEAVGNLEDNICVYITFVNQGNTCYYRYEKLRDQ